MCRYWLHGNRDPQQIEGLLLEPGGDGQAVERGQVAVVLDGVLGDLMTWG